jgi:5-methylcytosine-specific restriction endonuclease McrA
MMNAKQRGDAEGSWQAAHAALVELARERAGMDFEEACWLLAARRAAVHRQLGYGSFTEYVERLFGYAPRATHDKLRVAEALQSLPELASELRDGKLSFSHARELTRVATPETEKIWLESARGRTVREVEKLVSGRRPGSLPGSPTEPALEKHVLRFEVSGETLATFREAVAKLRREAGEHLDDDATLLLLARHVLGGPTDEGRASYQVAIDVCEDCQRARQHANGERIEVSTTVEAMANCDAQRISIAHVGAATDARASQDIAPAVRRSVLRRDQYRCRVPGCVHATFVDIHHILARADGGGHEPSNLVTLCGAHHRALHEGTLMVARSAAESLEFQHADGTPYGSLPTAPNAEAQTQVFRALRGLGFGEREARRALERVLRESGNAGEMQTVLRQSLAILTERAVAPAR